MKRPKKLQISELPVVVLTADTLTNLIDRINKLEKRLEEAEDTAQSNFDCLVDFAPRGTKSGQVLVKAYTDDASVEIVLRDAPAAELST